MPRNNRCVEAGLIYHVTQRGVDRQNVFFSHGDRTTYLALAAENVADCQVRVLAWCLMKNHVHWVIQAGRANSLAVFFQRIHGRYSQYLNARRGRSGHLWQNRFYSCPLGPSHLWSALRYVEANPIRAGLVDESEDYQWSSAQAHGIGPGAEEKPLLDWEFWTEAGCAKGWRDKVAETQDIRQTAQIRECTHSGKPFGEAKFIEQMEASFNRHWRPIGRPKSKILKREMGTEPSASQPLLQKGTGSG